MIKPALAVIGAAAVLAAGAATVAQERATFKAKADLVVLHVTVTGPSGAYVGGLTADAFRVFDEGTPQPIQLFEPEDAPVTIGLLVDSSGSMRGVRDRVIDAAAAFVQACNSGDEVFALTFNDDVRFVLPPQAPFTGDASTLRAALLAGLSPAGRTALYDAIGEGLQQVGRGTRDRRALIVVSDGGDNASRLTFAEARARVESSNTVIHGIAIFDPDEPEANPGKLRELADSTGGLSFSPRDVGGMPRAFEEIGRDIRHGYTIGYAPARDARSGSALRRLRVEVRAPDGSRLHARTRRAYLAGERDRAAHHGR